MASGLESSKARELVTLLAVDGGWVVEASVSTKTKSGEG